MIVQFDMTAEKSIESDVECACVCRGESVRVRLIQSVA